MKAVFSYEWKLKDLPCFVDRSHVIEQLLQEIKPASSMYYLVEGPHGCGKTTVLIQTVNKAAPGIKYVSVDVMEDFGL